MVTGTPRMVTDGLVLYLDAANTKSYPGSGTAWTDLSPSISSASLANGPTFSSDKAGGIVFDGTDDTVDFYAPNLGTTTTVEMWNRVPTFTSNKMFFGWNIYCVFTNNGNFGYCTGNSGDIYGLNSTAVTNLAMAGKWVHYVFEMRSDVPYSNNKLYVNTVAQSLTQVVNSETSVYRNFNSGFGRISGWKADNLYKLAMTCSIFRVYNRALTQSEISQNYEVHRERFGV